MWPCSNPQPPSTHCCTCHTPSARRSPTQEEPHRCTWRLGRQERWLRRSWQVPARGSQQRAGWERRLPARSGRRWRRSSCLPASRGCRTCRTPAGRSGWMGLWGVHGQAGGHKQAARGRAGRLLVWLLPMCPSTPPSARRSSCRSQAVARQRRRAQGQLLQSQSQERRGQLPGLLRRRLRGSARRWRRSSCLPASRGCRTCQPPSGQRSSACFREEGRQSTRQQAGRPGRQWVGRRGLLPRLLRRRRRGSGRRWRRSSCPTPSRGCRTCRMSAQDDGGGWVCKW